MRNEENIDQILYEVTYRQHKKYLISTTVHSSFNKGSKKTLKDKILCYAMIWMSTNNIFTKLII